MRRYKCAGLKQERRPFRDGVLISWDQRSVTAKHVHDRNSDHIVLGVDVAVVGDGGQTHAVIDTEAEAAFQLVADAEFQTDIRTGEESLTSTIVVAIGSLADINKPR